MMMCTRNSEFSSRTLMSTTVTWRMAAWLQTSANIYALCPVLGLCVCVSCQPRHGALRHARLAARATPDLKRQMMEEK